MGRLKLSLTLVYQAASEYLTACDAAGAPEPTVSPAPILTPPAPTVIDADTVVDLASSLPIGSRWRLVRQEALPTIEMRLTLRPRPNGSYIDIAQ